MDFLLVVLALFPKKVNLEEQRVKIVKENIQYEPLSDSAFKREWKREGMGIVSVCRFIAHDR